MTKNKKVLKFVEDSAALAQPDKIVWIDGSEAQRGRSPRGKRSLPAELTNSTKKLTSRTAICTERPKTTSLASRTERSFAAERKRTPCLIPS